MMGLQAAQLPPVRPPEQPQHACAQHVCVEVVGQLPRIGVWHASILALGGLIRCECE